MIVERHHRSVVFVAEVRCIGDDGEHFVNGILRVSKVNEETTHRWISNLLVEKIEVLRDERLIQILGCHRIFAGTRQTLHRWLFREITRLTEDDLQDQQQHLALSVPMKSIVIEVRTLALRLSGNRDRPTCLPQANINAVRRSRVLV